MNNEWEYYNHALVPTTAPHVEPDVSWIRNKKVWKEFAGGKYPLLVRWVTDFDCGQETEWWHCIKDEPFDIANIPAKKRYEISKGLKNVDVRIITPGEYAEELAEVQCKARIHYGETLDYAEEKEAIRKSFTEDPEIENAEYIGAFLKETGELIGYGIYEVHEDWVLQSVIKTNPDYLKCNTNAALVAFALERYFGDGFSIKYLTNGTKNVLHETNYHEYLMKYFGFRKAYCRLHIKYRGWVGAVVAVLYPFRKLFYKMKGRDPVRMVRAVLKMEEIHRTFR